MAPRIIPTLPAKPLLRQAALRGLTDAEVAETLGHEGNRVAKKRWMARIKTDGVDLLEADRFATAIEMRAEDIWPRYPDAISAYEAEEAERTGATIKFVADLPPAKTRGGPRMGKSAVWWPRLEPLTSHPHRWAQVRTCASINAAGQAVNRLRRRVYEYPAGKWEFAARGRRVFARFMDDFE